MKILGIETSCDETAAAVVEKGRQILSSVVASSQEVHKKYGGIIPEQAAREQVKYIIPVIKEALTTSQSTIKEVYALAVTTGPGLIGSLLTGVETAKSLSLSLNKPLVPVNHLLGHIYANFINQPAGSIKFPALCLIASGGHTELVLMKNHGKFNSIGGTRDDAAGECFDKCARLLGWGYPGGPAIEKKAKKAEHQSVIKLPRPMINKKSFDFSFSGLKTALFYQVKKLKTAKKLTSKVKNQLAREVEEAISDVLLAKSLQAAKKLKVKSILIGGGVTANQRLRDKFRSATSNQQPAKLFIPLKKLSTDNGAVIAAAAFYNFKPLDWSKIKADPSLEIQ